MKTSEFVQLLQNELILPRDPHLADRFAALLDENYEPVAPKEPTPADGVNVAPSHPQRTITGIQDGQLVTVPVTPVAGDVARLPEPSEADPTKPTEPVTSVYAPAPSLAESLPLTGSASTTEGGEFNPHPTESEAK